MKVGKKAMRIASVTLAATLGCGVLAAFAGCGGSNDTLIIMTQELNNLFNPFYSTAGTDMDVVGQTQISMFTTDSEANIAYGDAEPVVVKDYGYEYNSASDRTTYTFVLKNGITFSDGTPLTMNDVLFNMYVYLDPAYTGSTTMYSTKIVGLQAYRTQENTQDSGDGNDRDNEMAEGRVESRLAELINLYQTVGRKTSGDTTYRATEKQMRDAIDALTEVSQGYMEAVWPHGTPTAEQLSEAGVSTPLELAKKQLRTDYDHVLDLFREELENDYNAAKDAYQDAPYTNQEDEDGNLVVTNHTNVVFDEVTSFMYLEHYIETEYGKTTVGGKQKDDKNNIQKLTKNYDNITTREEAINYVFNDKVWTKFNQILTMFATGSTVQNEYRAKAKDVILHEKVGEGNTLAYPNIEGIRSLGHRLGALGADGKMTYSEWPQDTIVIKNTNNEEHEYAIAKEHNTDGTPAKANEYDVLQITINGQDPKAQWNFGFTVAPHHYYSDPDKYPVDIENNQFGVEWASFDFHSTVIQGTNIYGESKNKVPLGAGPYVATNRNDEDIENVGGTEFIENNRVFYKANEKFFEGVQDADSSLHPPYIKKMNYQVVSSSNAINNLERGGVHFVEPQFTNDNYERINNLASSGIHYAESWQLGYGYIGINAGKVPNINLRKAIMSAMDTSLALGYYRTGTADTINWPMSMVNWAYPRSGATDPNDPRVGKNKTNGKEWTNFDDDDTAKDRIRRYMQDAGVEEGDSSLDITFTIAGSDLTDHPCYAVFRHAMDLLNECGWNIELIPDTNALIKLATGSLTVWAAAWGSTIDPDMYQVYDKYSTATSVYAWGYREILADSGREENDILNSLHELIMDARETINQAERTRLYKDAMGYVLDLAVELPVYQRKTLYAYNANVIDESTLTLPINPYSSPLGDIWEIKLK